VQNERWIIYTERVAREVGLVSTPDINSIPTFIMPDFHY